MTASPAEASGGGARQRWRLTVAIAPPAADLTERALLDALVGGFAGAGLPIATAGTARPKPRVALAAPLPRGAIAEVDLVELFLADRLPVDEVRQRASLGLPAGMRLVALEDEWIGAPSLASRVAAVVYRVDVLGAPGTAAPAVPDGGPVRLVEWDEERGRGMLAVRFERDAAGRLGRPLEAVQAVAGELRVTALIRVSVELAGE